MGRTPGEDVGEYGGPSISYGPRSDNRKPGVLPPLAPTGVIFFFFPRDVTPGRHLHAREGEEQGKPGTARLPTRPRSANWKSRALQKNHLSGRVFCSTLRTYMRCLLLSSNLYTGPRIAPASEWLASHMPPLPVHKTATNSSGQMEKPVLFLKRFKEPEIIRETRGWFDVGMAFRGVVT